MEERQMEVTINYNGQAVAVEVTLEVYEFLDRADHKTENLFHEQRRHWDGREFDEYIITTEGVGAYGETPEEYPSLRQTVRPQPGRCAEHHPRAGRSKREAQSCRFRPVEMCTTRTYHALAQPVE